MASNPRDIKWPTDTTGFLYRLKHAGVQAVEKQYGHEGKHETLIATLEVLLEHAKDRFAVQHKNKQALRKSLEPQVKDDAAVKQKVEYK